MVEGIMPISQQTERLRKLNGFFCFLTFERNSANSLHGNRVDCRSYRYRWMWLRSPHILYSTVAAES